MKLWRETVSAAIVGTERQKFEPSAQSLGALGLVSPPETQNQETTLLKTAALLGVYRRAGVKSISDREAAPEAVENENLPLTSARSEHHLENLLAGNYKEVVPEFFMLAAQNGRVLPARFLPAVLDLAGARRELQPLVPPLLGARGRWLALHNENWAWAAAADERIEEIWQTGARGERLALIENLRGRDAARARELLKDSWQTEAAKERAAFVAALRKTIEPADEEFLTDALKNDKSLDVRRAAFELLLKIPDSALVKELTERAAALLEFTPGGFLKKAKLDVVFPADFEKEDKHDALNNLELYLDERKLGKKAVKLIKLLHAVPPRVWEKRFSADRKTLFDAAGRGDWQVPIFNGFKSSAIVYADADWLLAVLEVSGQTDYSQIANRIGRDWAPAQIENLIVTLLGGNFKKGVAKHFAALLFFKLEKGWSESFTERILRFLTNKNELKDPESFDTLVYYLLFAGGQISHRFLERFEGKPITAILEKTSENQNLTNAVEEFRATIRFRREMRETFQNE